MNKNPDNQFKIKLGFFFPAGGFVFGLLCVCFASALLVSFAIDIVRSKDPSISTGCLGFFLFLFGLTFFSTRHILIDKSKQIIEEQTKCIGIIFKTDIDLHKFKCITILRQLYGVTSKSVYSLDVKSQFYRYDVILLNSNHLSKLKIGTYKTPEQAKEFAKRVSEFLNFELVKFNPTRTKKRHNNA